jgi:MFS family permease
VSADVAAATLDPEKTLSWEKRHRPRAAIASLIGALGLLVYYIAMERLRSGGPSISGLEALQRGVASGPVADLPSLRLAEFQYLHDQQWLVLAIGIGAFIGFVGMAWAAGFLGVATRARSAEFRRFLIYVPIIGGVILGLGTLIIQVSVAALTSDFLDGPRTVESATRTSTTLQQFGQVMFSIGSLLLAVGLVVIALNAMRVGLLTKLLGYIGIVAGALLVLVPLPVVQVFWVGALGFLFLGRWPGGDLPAWRTGKAEPWPNATAAAQARAERGAATQPAGPQQPKPSSGRSKRKKRN